MAEIETDNEFEDLPEVANNEERDPVVLAYRMGDHRRYVRLRRSEVRADPGLIEVGESALSFGYDPVESLNREPEEARPADAYVQRKIQFKLMAKEIRKRIDAKNLSLKSFPEIHDLKSMNDPVAHYILTLVTDQLIAEGLWRDEDKDLTMTEAFPLSQAANESRIRLTGFDNIQESSIWQDSELTAEEISEENTTATPASAPMHLPTYATSMLNNLMRASPKDLYHQGARRMIETHYFQDHPELNELYRACFFAAKGVEDDSHFLALMEAGLAVAFPHYTFTQFRIERVVLRKHIRVLIGNYFSQTPAIQRRLKLVHQDTSEAMNVWARFYKVWSNLTAKQKEALECVYMNQSRISKKAAAEKFGITINSLISRLRVAVLRFKAEFQEFEWMSPRRIPQKALRGSVALGGLWRYQSAAWKSALFAVDPVTGFKREIEWRKMPKSKNLDWKTVAYIKAQIMENCPVPHILDTQYFDGMKPTIMSLGRKPEKARDDDGGEPDLDAGFRDLD
jgi:hypothetical protein